MENTILINGQEQGIGDLFMLLASSLPKGHVIELKKEGITYGMRDTEGNTRTIVNNDLCTKLCLEGA